MLNMRNRVLLYVVHFVICFFVHENGNVDIIAEYRDYSILTKMVLYYSLWEIYFVFFDRILGIGLRLCSSNCPSMDLKHIYK